MRPADLLDANPDLAAVFDGQYVGAHFVGGPAHTANYGQIASLLATQSPLKVDVRPNPEQTPNVTARVGRLRVTLMDHYGHRPLRGVAS